MAENDIHPVKRPIIAIQVPCDRQGNPQDWMVGQNCTRIEACEKPGEYCYLPYIRVWRGEDCLGEFCQHKLSGVWFEGGISP